MTAHIITEELSSTTEFSLQVSYMFFKEAVLVLNIMHMQQHKIKKNRLTYTFMEHSTNID